MPGAHGSSCVQGLIENKNIGHVFDAVALLASSDAWTADDAAAMDAWAASYLEFLVSDYTLPERKNISSHGTYYDVQLVSVLLYLKRCARTEATHTCIA
jgi:hypothetical protein